MQPPCSKASSLPLLWERTTTSWLHSFDSWVPGLAAPALGAQEAAQTIGKGSAEAS
ncbi:hypothetical protein YA0721_05720, partial [Pseudomonas carnis]|nr:hypothetical protein [Pseudomonas carnis]